MDFIIWFLIIILVLLPLLYLGIGAYAAVTLTRVGDHPKFDHTPDEFGVSYEVVRFYSRGDQLQLAGWYLAKTGAEHAVILVHGRNASKQNAISGRLPELASELHRAGLSVLVIDLRGHGESEGKRYMWGVHERRDVLGAVDFLRKKGFQPGKIGALGISLGGAAAIGAAFEDESIGALILDSTFANLMYLIDENWKKESGLPRFLLPGVFWMWQLLFGFGIKDVSSVNDIIQISSRPILILHSKTDEVVPIRHALKLVEAASDAELLLFDSCEHAELFRDQPEVYLDAVVSFLHREIT